MTKQYSWKRDSKTGELIPPDWVKNVRIKSVEGSNNTFMLSLDNLPTEAITAIPDRDFVDETL